MLVSAQERIREPFRWTQGAHAKSLQRLPTGTVGWWPTSFQDDDAEKWCPLGTIRLTAKERGISRFLTGLDSMPEVIATLPPEEAACREPYAVAIEALSSVVTNEYYPFIPTWNDAEERTHEDVMDAFSVAIMVLIYHSTPASERAPAPMEPLTV